MITVKIHTWKCNQCGYSQDFEPHQANMDLHFNNDRQFRHSDLEENECPSCRTKNGMEYITDESQMCEVKILEQSDIDVAAAKIEDITEKQAFIDSTIVKSVKEIQSFKDQYEYK